MLAPLLMRHMQSCDVTKGSDGTLGLVTTASARSYFHLPNFSKAANRGLTTLNEVNDQKQPQAQIKSETSTEKATILYSNINTWNALNELLTVNCKSTSSPIARTALVVKGDIQTKNKKKKNSQHRIETRNKPR